MASTEERSRYAELVAKWMASVDAAHLCNPDTEEWYICLNEADAIFEEMKKSPCHQ